MPTFLLASNQFIFSKEGIVARCLTLNAVHRHFIADYNLASCQ